MNTDITNLLQTDVYLKLSRAPQRLRQEITDDDRVVIIDEIQKLPILLDEVHNLIEEKGVHFLLTGSSARKLRNKGVDLKKASTSAFSRMVIDFLVGPFWGPRTFGGISECASATGRMRAKRASDKGGDSTASRSSLKTFSAFSIMLHLPAVCFTQTDNTDVASPPGVNHDVTRMPIRPNREIMSL